MSMGVSVVPKDTGRVEMKLGPCSVQWGRQSQEPQSYSGSGRVIDLNYIGNPESP